MTKNRYYNTLVPETQSVCLGGLAEEVVTLRFLPHRAASNNYMVECFLTAANVFVFKG
jgi:hypothetical protein